MRWDYPLALPLRSAWRVGSAWGEGAGLGVLVRFAGEEGVCWIWGCGEARAGAERAAGSLLANGRAGLADPLAARPSALGGRETARAR